MCIISVVLTGACTNDIGLDDIDVVNEHERSEVTVSVAPFVKEAGAETRATFLDVTDNEEYLMKFVPGDRFGICTIVEKDHFLFGANEEKENFPLVVNRQFFSNTGVLTAKCTIEGSLKKGVKYVVYYPYDENLYEGLGGKFLDFGGQQQIGFGNGDNVATNKNYFLSNVFEYDGVSLPKNITLNPLNSVVKIIAKNLPCGKYSKIELEDINNDVDSKSFFSLLFVEGFTADGVWYGSMVVGRLPNDGYRPGENYAPMRGIGYPSHSLSLQLKDCVVDDDESDDFYLTLFPTYASPFRIKAINEDGDVYYSNEVFSKKMAAGCGYELECTFRTPEYVDLGLPSGTKWATCNLGAKNEYDFGLYVKWGELYESSVWDSHATQYKWSQRSDDGNPEIETHEEYICKWDGKWDDPVYPKYTKYCTKASLGYDGFVDNKKILDEDDDIVKRYLGKNWMIPTHAQQVELLRNCTSEWTSNYMQTGKAGMIYTSKINGKSIFFPAAGYLYKGRKENDNYGGYYFSNEMASNNHAAYVIFFRKNRNSDSAEYNSAYYTQYRDVASSIRPVRK